MLRELGHDFFDMRCRAALFRPPVICLHPRYPGKEEEATVEAEGASLVQACTVCDAGAIKGQGTESHNWATGATGERVSDVAGFKDKEDEVDAEGEARLVVFPVRLSSQRRAGGLKT